VSSSQISTRRLPTDSQPPNTTILLTDAPDELSGEIALPGQGNLWVLFAYEGEPAPRVRLWHEGGEEVVVKPKQEQVLESRAGDGLRYTLGFTDQELKLVWAYV
jgi:hypothetical protein